MAESQYCVQGFVFRYLLQLRSVQRPISQTLGSAYSHWH